MRISEILTEQALDEINRRDFLKGLGATAGLAAMGQTVASTTDSDKKIIADMISLYWAYKFNNPESPNTNQLLSMIQSLAVKKPNINQLITSIGDSYAEFANNAPDRYDAQVKQLMANQSQIVTKFKSLK